jgi:hypothetical protein
MCLKVSAIFVYVMLLVQSFLHEPRLRVRYSDGVTGWRTEKSGSDCRQWQETLLSFKMCPKLLWGITMLLLIGWRGPLPGV